MSQEVIAILQKSLVENEQVKRRQVVAFAALFLATIGILLWIGHLANQPGTDVRAMVVWSVVAMLFAICYGAMALAIYINRTMARLLGTLRRISEQI
jgi:multisubunit Na+/H+ antiporter MnhB subunit